MTIETKKLVISEELKRKVEMICKFAYVEYSFTNGYIINLKNTNIAYVKPHILKVKGNDYLIFEDSENVFINGYNNKIKFKDLEQYLKMIGKTEEEMRKEYEPQAIEAIKSRLVLEAIMKAEKIEASEEEIKAKMEEMAKSYGKDVEELSKNENLKNYLAEGIKSEKALEFIVNNAKVTEKKKETKKATSKK